jgi:hypothetical protein
MNSADAAISALASYRGSPSDAMSRGSVLGALPAFKALRSRGFKSGACNPLEFGVLLGGSVSFTQISHRRASCACQFDTTTIEGAAPGSSGTVMRNRSPLCEAPYALSRGYRLWSPV